MAKYIDADLLRKEIDNVEEEARKVRVSGTDKEAIGADGKVKLCLELKAIINSLQQEEPEKPVSKDLEKFATISLEEAETLADEYTDFLAKGLIENQPRPIGGKWFIEYARKRFIAGAKWDREQIMKGAVEREVGMNGEPIKITFDKYVQRARGIWPGDKVRIIIVKED